MGDDMPRGYRKRHARTDRLEAVRRVTAGADRVTVAAAYGVTVGTVDSWCRRLAEASRTEEPSAVARLVPPEPAIDPLELEYLPRLRWEYAQTLSDIETARANNSITAIAALRRHLQDIAEKVEAIERADREGVDGADMATVAAACLVLARHPMCMELIHADPECRAEWARLEGE